MNKIKCFFGYHQWHYRLSKFVDRSKLTTSGNKVYLDSFIYPTRFCLRCSKKQVRQREDMRNYWIDTSLTKQELRQKNLSRLFDES